MKLDRHQARADVIRVVCAPLVLAIVEVFHPHPTDLLKLPLPVWLCVHFAQIVLFPLAALSVVALIRGRRGIAALVCRVAMFVFAISFTAFDTAAGVVTGILVKVARRSDAPEAWRQPIEALWNYPFMGGGWALDHIPSLAEIGSVSLPVGTFAAAAVLKRAGRAWSPVILLAISGLGIALFDTHAWPGGPLTFGGIALAGGWLQWAGQRARVPARVMPADMAARDELGVRWGARE